MKIWFSHVISSTGCPNSEFLTKETILDNTNLQRIKNLSEWVFFPIETEPHKRSRGFYLCEFYNFCILSGFKNGGHNYFFCTALGQDNVYRYEGYNGWKKIADVRINMSKNTLVYGEIVYGNKSRACFHIMDAFSLGEVDTLFELPYEDR